MPYAGGDRIKETCSSPGASAFVLTGAVVGEIVRTFSAAEDGQYLRYMAKHSTAAEAEVGAGLYTHSTRTLTRLHRSYPSEGAGVVTFSAGVVHVANTPSVRDVVPWQAATDPTTGDDIADGFIRGNRWINTSSGAVFECINPAPGAAVWDQVSGGGGAVALGALTDVGTATPTAGHLLQADGDSWEGVASTAITGDFRGAGVETLAETFAAVGSSSVIDVDDPGNYSVTSFKVGADGANKNEQRRFTSNDNHLIEFIAANLSDGDYGWLIRGGTGTVSLVYNNIPLNGATANITGGLKSKIKWTVHDGEVLIDGGTGEPVNMNGVAVYGNLARVITRGAGSTQPTLADSGTWITTNGNITIPNTGVGDSWFHCTLEFGGAHNVSFNSLTWAAGSAAGDIVSVMVKSATTIRITPMIDTADVINESDFS